jgi:hypothetical protein
VGIPHGYAGVKELKPLMYSLTFHQIVPLIINMYPISLYFILKNIHCIYGIEKDVKRNFNLHMFYCIVNQNIIITL